MSSGSSLPEQPGSSGACKAEMKWISIAEIECYLFVVRQADVHNCEWACFARPATQHAAAVLSSDESSSHGRARPLCVHTDRLLERWQKRQRECTARSLGLHHHHCAHGLKTSVKCVSPCLQCPLRAHDCSSSLQGAELVH